MNSELYKNRFQSNILVTGLVRNGASTIKTDVTRLNKALAKFKSLQWLLIESDSDDNTVEELEKIQNAVVNFNYLALGSLKSKLPLRTDRISFCRNRYLKEINENPSYSEVNYVIIADFDNLNTLINEEAISSCWENDGWDVCTANQKGPYYDIFALRHPHWSPGNHRDSFLFYKALGLSNYTAEYKSLISKMITIPSESNWIAVDSAFGGFGIYRKAVLEFMIYEGLDKSGNPICEHVPATLGLKEKGFKIYINPRLINCGYNEHTNHLKHLLIYKIRVDYVPSTFKSLFAVFNFKK